MKKTSSLILCLGLITLCLSFAAREAFGQTASAVSCADDFVSNQVMTGKVKAWDLAGVWSFLTNGNVNLGTDENGKQLPAPEAGPIDSQWQSRTKALSADFTVHRSIYEENGCLCDLRPGDLLIYSVSWEKLGGVAVINSLDTKRLMGDVSLYIEGSGKIQRITNFSFSLDPEDAPKRFFRPGLVFLKLRNAKYCHN